MRRCDRLPPKRCTSGRMPEGFLCVPGCVSWQMSGFPLSSMPVILVQKSVEPSRLLEEEGDLDLSADVSQAGRELT